MHVVLADDGILGLVKKKDDYDSFYDKSDLRPWVSISVFC